MLNGKMVRGTVIPEMAIEDMREALSESEIWGFSLDKDVPDVIYILADSADELDTAMKKQDYFNEQYPKINWIAAVRDWGCVSKAHLICRGVIWFY